MNIDKTYKPLPLRFKVKEFENKLYGTYSIVKEYDPEDVQELEENYKELLVFIDHIKECIDTDTWGLEAIDEILKRHLGRK